MDSKEGIEKVAPVDAWAAGLLDPSLLQLGADDATMADPPREWADSLVDHVPHWMKPQGGNHTACMLGY